MTLTTERRYPFVLAALAAISSWLAGCDIEPHATQTIASIVTFGAITSGFVGTSLSILTSLNAPVMQCIRKTPYLGILKRYLGWSLAAGFALSLVGIGGLAFDAASSPPFVAALAFALVFCVACLFRLGGAMLEVFADPENVSRRG